MQDNIIDQITRGIDYCEAVTNFLNDIIQQEGKIERDNTKIWQGFLHRPEVNNEYWADIIVTLDWLLEEEPTHWRTYNKTQFWEAKRAFEEYRDRHPRVLDTKQDGVSLKGHAWKIIMTTREVFNAVKGRDVPNR